MIFLLAIAWMKGCITGFVAGVLFTNWVKNRKRRAERRPAYVRHYASWGAE